MPLPRRTSCGREVCPIAPQMVRRTLHVHRPQGAADQRVTPLALLDDCGDRELEITGPATIKNYTLYAQDDAFMAAWYALAGESHVPIWWGGVDLNDGIRLCESSDDAAVTCRSLGTHTCTGVLGQVLAHDNQVALVTCRDSVVDGSSVATWSSRSRSTRYDATVDETSPPGTRTASALGCSGSHAGRSTTR